MFSMSLADKLEDTPEQIVISNHVNFYVFIFIIIFLIGKNKFY